MCGVIIKLSRKWDEDYINRHARSNGCKRVEGQKTIYHFFDTKKHEINDSDEEWEDWNSEVEDAMDDNDIISVDEYEGKENISFIIDITGNENVNFTSNKRRACNGLCSASISEYIERTPAKFGGSCHIEVIAKEIWPNKFKKGFSRKRINIKEKRILNRQIYAESTWFIDRESKIILFLVYFIHTIEFFHNKIIYI